MPKNSESLNRTLFDLLHSRGYDPTMLDTSGKEIPTPEEAEVFQFDFTKDGENYGKVTMSIDGAHKLIIYFGDKVADSEKEESESSDLSWYKLLNQLKRFAQSYQLSFELRNVDNLKHDMAKREYMKKKESIQEGYYPMGKKASYNDAVPSVKIVLQHTRQIEEGEQRYRNIAKIFLENEQGERFLAPTTKPGIARVYARHIAEGGMPHDDRWNHIGSLCEEYQKMAGFVRATRNGQFNESTQRLVAEGINHYQKLRESLSKLAGHRGYTAYFESYSPPLMEDEESVDLSEMFMSSSLDPRIESVMPILAKLSKNVMEMAEIDELNEWADKLIEGGDGGEASEEQDVMTSGTAGEGGAEDAPEDDLTEEESLTSNNSQGIPEGMLDGSAEQDNPVVSAITRRILLQRTDLLAKFGPAKVMAAIDDVADFVGDTDEIGSSDVSGWIKQVEQSLGNAVDESALQAYLGDKKYGKDGMDALRKAGREHAGKEKMQDIRAKYSDKEEVTEVDMGQYDAVKAPLKGKDTDDWDKNFREKVKQYAKELEQRQKEKPEQVDEDEFAGDYATGEAGQWRNKGPKANKPATIGDFVGESQLDEMDKSDDVKGPEGKAKPITPKKMADDAKKVLDKKKVKEGQEDLDVIKRLLGK